MTHSSSRLLQVHGWTLLGHPLFLEQFRALTLEVESLASKDPSGYRNRNVTKRLAAICKLAFEVIPQDPPRPEYRQGATLGESHKHWLRAKFFQQFRLFFRYHAPSGLIVYAWVNDEDTLRAYDSRNDAYRVFHRMLERGTPPDVWEQLVAESLSISPSGPFINEPRNADRRAIMPSAFPA